MKDTSITYKEIENNLASLGAVVCYIRTDTVQRAGEYEIWFPGAGKLETFNDFREISGYNDLIEVNRLWVEERLNKHFSIPSGARNSIVYKILIALLTECKISETIPSLSPPAQWWRYALERFSQSIDSTGSPTAVFLRFKDTRRVLHALIPPVLKVSCLQVMETVNLQFPERSSEVDPHHIAEYQADDQYTQSWIYRGLSGKGLFLVLYTRRCRYAGCSACNLPQLGSPKRIHSCHINSQVNFAITGTLLLSEKKEIKEIILSNNGSTFDSRTLPTSSLLYFLTTASNHLPSLKKIVFETRVEYVEPVVLRLIRDTLAFDNKKIRLELAVGVEIFDDKKRNDVYGKDLSLQELEIMVKSIRDFDIQLRLYMMYKPLVGMSVREADEDIKKAVAYFDGLSVKYGTGITMHLNPTYVAENTGLEAAFKKGDYSPPHLSEVRQLLLSLKNTGINIYVGLNDEGLAIPGGSFIKPGSEEDYKKLQEFNYTGDFQCLA